LYNARAEDDMAGVEVSTAHFPVVLVKFDADQTMEDCDRFMAAMDAIHRRKLPYFSISYMRRYNTDRAQVKKVAEWMKANADKTRELCLATGIVTHSLGFRFLLSSIFLIRPMPCPYQVCGSFAEAIEFVRGFGEQRGIAMPDVPNIWSC
jgi:hypothetical protein